MREGGREVREMVGGREVKEAGEGGRGGREGAEGGRGEERVGRR